MLLKIAYSESAYPITPVGPMNAILYYYFGIRVYFLLSNHMNNNRFTYDKTKSAELGFNILDMF